MRSKLSELNSHQKSVLEEFGAQGFTVAYISFELTRRYHQDGASFSPSHSFLDLVKFEGWTADQEVPDLSEVAPEEIVEPELVAVEASRYVLESDGESIPFHASCSTRITLNEDNNLVFRNTDDESFCVLNINDLISDVGTKRREYDIAMQNHANAQFVGQPADADEF